MKDEMNSKNRETVAGESADTHAMCDEVNLKESDYIECRFIPETSQSDDGACVQESKVSVRAGGTGSRAKRPSRASYRERIEQLEDENRALMVRVVELSNALIREKDKKISQLEYELNLSKR